MGRPTTILFDFDGTIADTVQAGVDAFNSLARDLGFLEITAENADTLRAVGPRGAIKELEVPWLRVPAVLRALRDGVRLALPTLEPVVGVRSAVLSLRDQGCRLGIVTSNLESNVRQFLAHNRMECFDYLQPGAGFFNKAAKVRLLMAREGLKFNETAFVGDEIRDVEAAKKNKLAAVGVTWGVNSREGLAGARPDAIVDTAGELLEYLTAGYRRMSSPRVPIAMQ